MLATTHFPFDFLVAKFLIRQVRELAGPWMYICRIKNHYSMSLDFLLASKHSFFGLTKDPTIHIAGGYFYVSWVFFLESGLQVNYLFVLKRPQCIILELPVTSI